MTIEFFSHEAMVMWTLVLEDTTFPFPEFHYGSFSKQFVEKFS